MVPVLAASFSVSGLHGALLLLAVLAFLVAAIIAAVVIPRNWWAVLVAAGLFLATLAALVSG